MVSWSGFLENMSALCLPLILYLPVGVGGGDVDDDGRRISLLVRIKCSSCKN